MAESKEFYYVRWYKWDSEKQDYNVCESTYHYDTFEEAKKHYDKLVCDSDKPQIEIHKEILEGTDWRWGECVEDTRILMKESMAHGVEEMISVRMLKGEKNEVCRVRERMRHIVEEKLEEGLNTHEMFNILYDALQEICHILNAQ